MLYQNKRKSAQEKQKKEKETMGEITRQLDHVQKQDLERTGKHKIELQKQKG